MRFSRWLPWAVLGLVVHAVPGSTQSPGLSYPTPERVRTDFRKLLERPHSALQPEFSSHTVDDLIVQSGAFLSEPNEKVPTVLVKQVGRSG